MEEKTLIKREELVEINNSSELVSIAGGSGALFRKVVQKLARLASELGEYIPDFLSGIKEGYDEECK